MTCARCGRLLTKDIDELRCITCGLVSTPYRATDPVMRNVTRRNRRLWNPDEDMRVLILAPDWEALRVELRRPVHLIKQRWEEIREH